MACIAIFFDQINGLQISFEHFSTPALLHCKMNPGSYGSQLGHSCTKNYSLPEQWTICM